MYEIIGADGKEYGPITAEQLRGWIAQGRANAQTRACVEGTAHWRPLTEYLEFAPSLAGASSPLPTIGPLPLSGGAQNNPLAVTGMIMGILSVTIGLCCCYGLPFNLMGIIFSLVALSQIKADPASQGGRGMAIAGLTLSILSFVLVAVLFAFGLALNSSNIWQRLQKL